MTDQKIDGQSVFAIEIVPQGVQVKTVFLTNQGELLNHPAVFPNEDYAYQQIETLKQVVAEKFAEIKASQKSVKSVAPKAPKSSGSSNVVELFKK